MSFTRKERIILIHQYKNNGFNIVLDVNSGSVHVVDDVVYDVIACMVENQMEEMDKAVAMEKLLATGKFDKEVLAETIDEIFELKAVLCSCV